MFYPLRIFPLTCLLVAATSVGSDEHGQESVEFQAVNSYLSDFEPPLIAEPSLMVDRLSEAAEAIESLGVEFFGQLSTGNHSLGRLDNLMQTNAQVTLTVLRKLVAASLGDCNQESQDFLVLVVEHETFQGQILNQYARNLLAHCWQLNSEALEGRLERSAGKMSEALFTLLSDVANRLQGQVNRARRARGDLLIGEQLGSLKQVVLESHRLGHLASALRGALLATESADEDGDELERRAATRDERDRLRALYLSHLMVPCQELIWRMERALAKLLPYERYAAAGEELRSARGKVVEQQLEAFRICRQVAANEEAVWAALAS